MRRPRFTRLLLVALIPFLGCGHGPKTFDAVSVRGPDVSIAPIASAPKSHPRSAVAARAPAARLARRAQVRHWNETVLVDAMVANAEAARLVPAVSADPSRAPCDGDLPPCWRIIGIESGGRWDAYNPTGCDGHGCFGPYQFSGAWAGKLGLPADLWTTTHDQWIAAARELWNGGAGCRNWSACP